MQKNVLVLNGSPRVNGNTETMADALIEGIEKAGNTATKINLRELRLQPCTGCYKCIRKKGDPCVQKDDMHNIYAAFGNADTIVFASPLYWWQFSAQMKVVIDRMLAIGAQDNMVLPHKNCAMLIAAEDKREENFTQIISYYKTCLVGNLNWEDKGMVLAGGVVSVGDVQKTPFLEQARQLGENL